MRIQNFEEPDELTQPRKKPPKRFRDPENSARKRRNYLKNKAMRVEANRARRSEKSVDEAPAGLNKLGAGNKTTTGNKSHQPHFRGGQNHEFRP